MRQPSASGDVWCTIAIVLWCGMACAPGLSAAAAQVSKSVQRVSPGVWDVVRVAVDLQEQGRWIYRPNDARLLGRALTVTEEGLRLNGKLLSCDRVRWRAVTTTWEKLLAKSFVHADGHTGRRRIVTAGDLELPVEPRASVAIFPICASSPAARQSVYLGNWLAVLGARQLALHFDEEAILILELRQENPTIAASFPCGKAKTATERAICADYDLAAWDRSLSSVYKDACEFGRGDLIRAEQESWIRERDSCGGDRDCLEVSLRDRVNQLAMSYW